MPSSGLRGRPFPPGPLHDSMRVRKVPTAQRKRQRSRVGSWPSPPSEARLREVSRQVSLESEMAGREEEEGRTLVLNYLYMWPEAASEPPCLVGLGPETAWSVVSNLVCGVGSRAKERREGWGPGASGCSHLLPASLPPEQTSMSGSTPCPAWQGLGDVT